jgi:hypothetical protein
VDSVDLVPQHILPPNIGINAATVVRITAETMPFYYLLRLHLTLIRGRAFTLNADKVKHRQEP